MVLVAFIARVKYLLLGEHPVLADVVPIAKPKTINRLLEIQMHRRLGWFNKENRRLAN